MAEEKLVYSGKSKDVFEINGGKYAGKYRFVFTDRGTGYIERGKPVFDPGYDVVVGEIPGKGAIACKFATYFFRLLQEKGIPTHYIDTVSENEMIVRPATPISMKAEAPEFEGSAPMQNVEWTWRNNAQGSFWRRYPFVKPGKNLGKVVEAWTKGDSDTLITFEALEASGAMTKEEIDYSEKLVRDIAEIVSREFEAKGLHVIDGKFELGRLKGENEIVLIDEISPDVLRVCRGYVPDERWDCKVYRECIKTKFSDGKRKIVGKNQLNADELRDIFM
jgi:phosphoribosylaminoimidazole-succinocarboxamide synthase